MTSPGEGLPGAGPIPWATAWRLARRGLSARFKGLRLLLVCLFLGVGALAAIGTLTGSIERELAARGRAILGGDLELEVWQRDLTAAERAALDALGTVSIGSRLQAMASAGDLAAPVQLKAVDGRWPLVGQLRLHLALVSSQLNDVRIYDTAASRLERALKR